MKKVVVKLDLHDDKEKQKALKAVATLDGIDSIAMDMKEKKLTVVGTVDPVDVVAKLRKLWQATHIVSVGPAKEPAADVKKKDDGDKKKAEEAKKQQQQVADLVEAYYKQAYYNYPHPTTSSWLTPRYVVHSADDDHPNACLIS